MPQRIEPLKKYDSKNGTFFSQKKIDSKNWTFFLIWLKELNSFSCNWEICLKELNFSQKKVSKIFLKKYHSNFRSFFWDDSKNWTSFQHDSQNWTNFSFLSDYRIEPFFSTWLTEIEPFFSTWPKVLTYLLWIIWLKELNFFFKQKMTQRIEPLSNLTQRIELLKFDSKNWTLKEKWPKELNLFS